MKFSCPDLALVLWLVGGTVSARQTGQPTGSIRGVVYDQDFDVPLAGARVTNLETGQTTSTGDQGNYLLADVAPGTYTLVFSKEGYLRQVKPDVVVAAGRLTEVDAALSGEFTEMEEVVVQDLIQADAGTEGALLQMRFESPALMDSIGADLMSRAGASDAAAALKLVSGAALKEGKSGKSAVIRGLPDRYVSSQMNGVRLPSADEDKRAVELDQFPAAVIESIQVSKTFTPDQQGDTSGGAVNVRLRGIPDETVLGLKAQLGYNTNTYDGFLSYEGAGFDAFGNDDQDRRIQTENLGGNWDGAVGVSEDDEPLDYKLGFDFGRKFDLADGVKVGGFTSLFYERDSGYVDDKREDQLIVPGVGQPMVPDIVQGSSGDERTALFDITEGSQLVRFGGLGTLGLETERNTLGLTYLYTKNSEDTATLALDTRGKQFFYPGHDPLDPTTPGNDQLDSAPYIRSETLEFTERTTETLQLNGRHTLPWEGYTLGSSLRFGAPELDWILARSSAGMDQPDKRQFASVWKPFGTGIWEGYRPAASFELGFAQRSFKQLEEESDQYQLNLEFPFELRERPGSLKLGAFDDSVDRLYRQETFSNFGDQSSFFGTFDQPWSEVFPDEDHPISDGAGFGGEQDVDYDGDQDIEALYTMAEVPLSDPLKLLVGVRFESTEISTVVVGEPDARWFDPNSATQGAVDLDQPGEADVSFSQDDVLPAIGLTYQPFPSVTLRAHYAETIARQTFKELTPIIQQEYVGGPVFTGNPNLQMSSLKNYDLRADYVPYEGSLFSLSWFHKDIEDAIEYVQFVTTFSYTQPRNYPEGEMNGFEVEIRQRLDRFSEGLEGLALGANATFIDSEVTLPASEAQDLAQNGFPITSRDATDAPEYLYNLYLTYDVLDWQFGVFYSVLGDTLLAGAGNDGSLFVPSIYQTDYGTLNLTLSRRIGEHFRLRFEAKNLTDPDIETVYRSEFIGGDVTKSSYSIGREFSLSLTAQL